VQGEPASYAPDMHRASAPRVGFVLPLVASLMLILGAALSSQPRGLAQEESVPPPEVPPGMYSYEEASSLGLDTGPSPTEAGLPLCEVDPTWPGLPKDDEAQPVLHDPAECVADMRQVEYGVGFPAPHAGPCSSGHDYRFYALKGNC